MKSVPAMAVLVTLRLAIGGPPELAAQDADSLRASWRIGLPPSLAVVTLSGGISPASTSASPSAFGAAWGDGFVGAGYQARTRFTSTEDASFVVGFGVGDPTRYLGLEVGVTSVSTLDDGPFRRGTVSFKLHRSLPGAWGVALGYENAAAFDFDDDEDPDGGRSLYGVVSKVWGLEGFTPFRTLTASVGVGDGRFRSEADVFSDEGTLGVFGAVGIQVWAPLSLIADWSGQDLTLGASVVPFRETPLIITPAITDVTGSAGDGVRFILGAGVGFAFADFPWFVP